jgi:hypothetical protein
MSHVKVVGLGGIGGWLATPLAQYLNYASPSSVLTLIDGDCFEQTNSPRQFFHRSGNKAIVIKERLAGAFPYVTFAAQAKYVTSDNIAGLIYNTDIVFVCVDNHATRKIISDHCENLPEVLVISGGNSDASFSAQVFMRKSGCNVTLPLANQFHPEILKPQDNHPEDLPCEQLAAAKPQVIFTNNTIAALMLNAYYAILQQGVAMYDDLYGDILDNCCVTVTRSKKTEI